MITCSNLWACRGHSHSNRHRGIQATLVKELWALTEVKGHSQYLSTMGWVFGKSILPSCHLSPLYFLLLFWTEASQFYATPSIYSCFYLLSYRGSLQRTLPRHRPQSVLGLTLKSFGVDFFLCVRILVSCMWMASFLSTMFDIHNNRVIEPV